MQSNGPTTTLARLVRRPGKGGQTTGNRCRMRSGRAMRLVLMSVVSLAVSLVSVGEVDASCGSSQRLKHSSSECLAARYNNTGNWINPNSEFYANNACPRYGKVVAKIDIKHGTDYTWHLTSGGLRSGFDNKHVRQIWCCKDLSDLCNKSDVVTATGCRAQFNKSPAATTSPACMLSQDPTATADGDNPLSCNFHNVWCLQTHAATGIIEGMESSSLTQVRYYDADELINCNGALKKAGGC